MDASVFIFISFFDVNIKFPQQNINRSEAGNGNLYKLATIILFHKFYSRLFYQNVSMSNSQLDR